MQDLNASCYRQLCFASKSIAPVVLYSYRLFQKKLLTPVRSSGPGLPFKALALCWCQQELQSEHRERLMRQEKGMAEGGLSVEGDRLI